MRKYKQGQLQYRLFSTRGQGKETDEHSTVWSTANEISTLSHEKAFVRKQVECCNQMLGKKALFNLLCGDRAFRRQINSQSITKLHHSERSDYKDLIDPAIKHQSHEGRMIRQHWMSLSSTIISIVKLFIDPLIHLFKTVSLKYYVCHALFDEHLLWKKEIILNLP